MNNPSVVTRPLVAVSMLLASIVACGGDPKPPGESSNEAADLTSGSAVAERPTKPKVIPESIDDVLMAVPEMAPIVVTIPALTSTLPKELVDTALPLVIQEIASGSGVSEGTVRALIDGSEGAAVFATSDELGGDELPVAVVARFKEANPFEDLLKELALEEAAEGRYVLKRDAKGPLRTVHIAWLAKQRVALLSPKEASLQAALDTLMGQNASFKASPHAKTITKDKLFAYGDLHRLVKSPEAFANGSLALLTFGVEDTLLQYKQIGEKVPRLSTVLAPSSHDALAKLPGKPMLALDLSLARRPGKGLPDLFKELARATGTDLTSTADKSLKDLGLSLADIDRALGDGLTLGIYLPEGVMDPTKIGDQGTFLALLSVKDDAVVRKLFDTAKAIGAKDKKFKFTANRVVVQVDATRQAIVEVQPGSVLLAFGSKVSGEKLVAAYKRGVGTLGEAPGFVEYKSKASPSQMTVYVDYDQIMKSTGQALPLTGADASDLFLADSDQGLDISVRGGAAIPIVGVMSAMAIYGVRRYLQSAKSSEAKNAVGAIARGAVGAFEREHIVGSTAGHALCKTAQPVPADVPKGVKHATSTSPGKDFDTGDDTTGWKCLKFTMSTPIYYKYEYRVGGNYKCPSRGGVDPGPNGFEISAEGDLDGDGTTSLFCHTGVVDKATNAIKLGTQLFIVDEFE